MAVEMDNQKNEYFVSDNKSLLQIDRIHNFLSTKAYWCLGIPKPVVEKAIDASICFGVYQNKSNNQVGFARVVTDKATFAWLCDVYVEDEHRNNGLAKRLMVFIKTHPDLQSLRRFCLTTKDAHWLYESFDFQITKTPNAWMEIKDNDIYQKMNLEVKV